jgi:hypothetical protein
MARYPFDQFTNVIWVPGANGVADISAPSVAEIAAGTDLTCFITKDGLNPGGTTNKVDDGALCNRLDAQLVGSVGYDFTLKLKRDNDSDDAWTLASWGAEGYLVIRRGVLYETAFASGQPVEVFHAQMGEPVMAPSATNTQQMFDLTLAISDANQKATVAA